MSAHNAEYACDVVDAIEVALHANAHPFDVDCLTDPLVACRVRNECADEAALVINVIRNAGFLLVPSKAAEELLSVFAFDRLGQGASVKDQAERIGSNSAWGSDARFVVLQALSAIAAAQHFDGSGAREGISE